MLRVWMISASCALGFLLSSVDAGSGQSLPAAADSARAVKAAVLAAREEVVAGYGVLAAVAVPAAVATVAVIAIAGPDDTPPQMIAGPIAFGLVLRAASKRDAQPSSVVSGLIATESPEYQEVFRKTYAETLRMRRRKAFSIGAFTGSIAAIFVVGALLGARS